MEGRKKESYTQQNAIAAPRRSVTAGRVTDHTPSAVRPIQSGAQEVNRERGTHAFGCVLALGHSAGWLRCARLIHTDGGTRSRSDFYAHAISSIAPSATPCCSPTCVHANNCPTNNCPAPANRHTDSRSGCSY